MPTSHMPIKEREQVSGDCHQSISVQVNPKAPISTSMSDKDPIEPGDTYQTKGITLGRFSFKMREMLIAVGLVVLLVMCFVFVGLFAHANNATSDDKNAAGSSAQKMGTTASPEGNDTTNGTTKRTTTPKPPTTPTPDPRICNSVPCLKGSAYVLRLMDTSVDPCEDFYTYACGNWATRYPLKPNRYRSSPEDNLLDANWQKVRTMLGSDVLRNTPWAAERKAKHFYTSCMDSYGRMVAGGNPVVDKVLSKIGGWWLVHGLPSDWNILSAIEKVHVDFWTDVLFKVYVGWDYSYSGGYRDSRPIIRIARGGLGMGFYSYYTSSRYNKTRIDYKTYMRKVATLLARDGGATPGPALDTKINTFVSDVMLFETKLANVTMLSASSYSYSSRITLKKLNNQTQNLVDWVSFMKYMFTGAGITENTNISLLYGDYMGGVADIIWQLPSEDRNRVLNNYFVWQIAVKYAGDLSYEYIHAKDRYLRDLNGWAEPQDPSDYCFYQVRYSMDTVLSHIFINDHFSDQGKKKAVEIANFVKGSLVERVDNMTFMDATTKAFAKKKLKGTLDRLGYPDWIMDSDVVDLIYYELNVSSSNYFDNVLSLNGFLRKDAHNRLLGINGETHPEWRGNTFDIYIYFYYANELQAPAGALQDPFYDKDRPHYLNFGSIGSMFAYKYIDAIDRYGMYYDENGERYRTASGARSGWWSSSTLNKYNNVTTCFQDFYVNKTAGSYEDADGNIITVLVTPIQAMYYDDTAAQEVGGAQVAYQAYRDWIQKNGKEKLAPGMDQTNDQMFFLAYAQTKCNVMRPYYTSPVNPYFPIPDSLKLNGAMAMMPEFSAAFGCSADSTLNPKKKCSLF